MIPPELATEVIPSPRVALPAAFGTECATGRRGGVVVGRVEDHSHRHGDSDVGRLAFCNGDGGGGLVVGGGRGVRRAALELFQIEMEVALI